MAVPPALRLAIEACRPTKSSVLRLRPFLQSRQITSTHAHRSIDITQGFPEPQVKQPQLHPEVDTMQSSHDHDSVASPATTPEPEAATAPSPPAPSESATQPPQRAGQILQSPKPLPPNVLAAYRVPMKHRPQYGLPVASLQLRSYSVRNLEFFADFCLRAAFYLKLPASGPVPLPRKTERWTTLRSNFVHKKSQENFERITYRRLITIMDGHNDVVERWLAFIRKWQFYGVGMKANVWEFSSLDVGAKMDQAYQGQVEKELTEKLKDFGFNKTIGDKTSLDRLLRRQGTKQVGVPVAGVRERSLTDEERAWNQGLEMEAKKAA